MGFKMKHFLEKDQKKVSLFIKELAKKLVEEFPKEIDFIILYGSAARKEFIPGVSDIDLIIQTKHQESVPIVERRALEIFWQLNKKYRLGFERVCKQQNSKEGFIPNLLKAIEKQTPLFKPIFVFGPEDLDWRHGEIKHKKLFLKAKLFACQYSIFSHFKKEGKIIYGRDIRKEIKVKFSLWEKIKNFLIPFYLLFGSVILIPFFSKRSLNYMTKSVIWGMESLLLEYGFLKKASIEKKTKFFKKISQKEIELLEKYLSVILKEKRKELGRSFFKTLSKAIEYKLNQPSLSFTKRLKFLIEAWVFLLGVNLIGIKRILREIKLK